MLKLLQTITDKIFLIDQHRQELNSDEVLFYNRPRVISALEDAPSILQVLTEGYDPRCFAEHLAELVTEPLDLPQEDCRLTDRRQESACSHLYLQALKTLINL